MLDLQEYYTIMPNCSSSKLKNITMRTGFREQIQTLPIWFGKESLVFLELQISFNIGIFLLIIKITEL